MKRIHLLITILVLLAIYLSAWHLLPAQEMDFLVVNKTVPQTDYRGHESIFWLAEHWRIKDEDKEFKKHDADYLGYHPETGQKDQVLANHLSGIDLLYLVDAYGVYDHADNLETYEKRLQEEEISVELEYGGFDQNEVDAVEKYASGKDSLLVGEHNIWGYPTYKDPEASRQLQELFEVNYEGWLIRYYENLDDAPQWLKNLYGRIHGQEWNLRGSGIAVMREDVPALGWPEELLIFKDEDLKKPWPTINNTNNSLTQGAASAVPYLNWLEVVDPHENTEVLSYFNLPLSQEAEKRLERRGLEAKIPAMIYHQTDEGAERIYFTGNFAHQLSPILPSRLTGSARIQHLLTYLPGVPEEYSFFFQWYAPVLQNIMEKALT